MLSSFACCVCDIVCSVFYVVCGVFYVVCGVFYVVCGIACLLGGIVTCVFSFLFGTLSGFLCGANGVFGLVNWLWFSFF
jgi:hypothetical protein